MIESDTNALRPIERLRYSLYGTPRLVPLRLHGSIGGDFDNNGDYFNGGTPDGGVDINDLLYHLDAFGAGSSAADISNGTIGLPGGGVRSMNVR